MVAEAPSSDQELLRRFGEGDPEATRELLERSVPLLEGFIRRRLSSRLRRRLSVSDVMQEARLAACAARGLAAADAAPGAGSGESDG